MARGRPRLFDPSLPRHIDQARIPKGAYWDRSSGSWYAIVDRKRCKLADKSASLADLARGLESIAGVERGTLGYLCDRFHESEQFKRLARGSQGDYQQQRRILGDYRTRTGLPLADLRIAGLTKPFLQRVVDKIGAKHPSKANHLLRYVRRVFAWGEQRGFAHMNPARGIEAAKERRLRRLPTDLLHMQVLAQAQAWAALPGRRKDAVAHYLPRAMELGYLLLLRPIEVVTLSDANETREGIQTNRRKGSRDTVVLWSPRLSAAWQDAQTYRARVWEKRHLAVSWTPEQRPVLVGATGHPVSVNALKQAWGDFMRRMVAEGLITTEQRFGLHDMKRKGITDTDGTRADKREASGHRQDAMMDVYDLSLARVRTPKGA